MVKNKMEFVRHNSRTVVIHFAIVSILYLYECIKYTIIKQMQRKMEESNISSHTEM